MSANAGNLLVNGGFEQPIVTRAEMWDVFETIPGWSTSSGCGIELSRDGVLGAPAEGAQLAELASDDLMATGCNPSSAEFQDVATRPGMKYELRFAYSPRPQVQDNRIEVSWDGASLAQLDGDGTPNADTV